jgi:hypothetical protein
MNQFDPMQVFGGFQQSIDTLMKNSVTNTVTLGTLLDVLVAKGIITKEEFQNLAKANLQKYVDDAKKYAEAEAKKIITPTAL